MSANRLFDLKAINRERRRKGLSPLPLPGLPGRPRGSWPSKALLVELYERQTLSIRAVADRLKADKNLICRALKEYGISARPKTRKPKAKE